MGQVQADLQTIEDVAALVTERPEDLVECRDPGRVDDDPAQAFRQPLPRSARAIVVVKRTRTRSDPR